VWVDQRTGSEFNVEIGARVVATQAGQIVLTDDDGQVNLIHKFSYILNHLSRKSVSLSKQNFVQCILARLKV
jgi:sorbitol-specific phosphotransferase system component IIA